MNDNDKIELNKAINKSGYPFQIGLEQYLTSIQSKTYWGVDGHEVPWKNTDNGSEGYVDLVMQRGVVKLVIECKRVLDEKWIFLSPSERKDWQMVYGLSISNDNTMIGSANWGKFFLEPRGFKSEFCVIDNKDRFLIEKEIAKLIDATEALSLQHIEAMKVSMIKKQLFLFPIIVTTATLVVSQFNPNEINLSDGKIDIGKNDFQEVGFVRFEKSIKTTRRTVSNIYSEKGIVTCLIVNVNFLEQLLINWNLTLDSWN